MKQFNVLRWNINQDVLEQYNVIPYLREEVLIRFEVLKQSKNSKDDKELTREKVKEYIIEASRYRFWSRCEYEMIIHGWPVRKNDYKIDIHEQIMMNIDVITDILFEELKS